MKINHKIAERAWKRIKPGFWRIGNVSVNRGYCGNIRIWFARSDDIVVMTITKHGGVVDGYVSVDKSFERRVPLSEASAIQVANALDAAMLNETALSHKTPAWLRCPANG